MYKQFWKSQTFRRKKSDPSFPGARMMERLLIAEGLGEMLGAAKGP